MTSSQSTSNPILFIRWATRISSILFIAVFLLMFLGEGFEPAKISMREWVSLFFFPFGLILGMILAWWKEGLGGAIAVGSLIAELFVGDVSGSGGGYMLICASPGFLFLLAWYLSKMEKTMRLPRDQGDVSAVDEHLS